LRVIRRVIEVVRPFFVEPLRGCYLRKNLNRETFVYPPRTFIYEERKREREKERKRERDTYANIKTIQMLSRVIKG